MDLATPVTNPINGDVFYTEARKRKHPPAKMAWQARLNIKDHVWEDAASRCTTTFLTPRDVHTHYKHIIHRALTTRERGLTPQCGTLCRMCGLKKENSLHMGECNVIRKLFMRINSLKALEDPFIFPLTPAARKHQAIRILFATPAEGAPQATSVPSRSPASASNIFFSKHGEEEDGQEEDGEEEEEEFPWEDPENRRNLRQAVMMPRSREVGAGAEEACQVATRECSA
eukprot:scaffold10064_cov130-Isochrysis_galbana.AAC.6